MCSSNKHIDKDCYGKQNKLTQVHYSQGEGPHECIVPKIKIIEIINQIKIENNVCLSMGIH